MSELKRHHINEVMDMHNLTKGEMGYSIVYYADDVDKVIAEKDKEIAELKSEIRRKEAVEQRWFEQCMEARSEAIRLKRALWLARAYRSRDNSILLPSKFMRNVWDNVERKCRAKAEEYK